MKLKGKALLSLLIVLTLLVQLFAVSASATYGESLTWDYEAYDLSGQLADVPDLAYSVQMGGSMAELMNSGLSIRRFDRPDIQWATFVMNNRSAKNIDVNSPECNLINQYDIVIGPVANDDLALLFRQFEEGFVDIGILTREMTYKKLTNQYSFHTQRAVALLKKEGVIR